MLFPFFEAMYLFLKCENKAAPERVRILWRISRDSEIEYRPIGFRLQEYVIVGEIAQHGGSIGASRSVVSGSILSASDSQWTAM